MSLLSQTKINAFKGQWAFMLVVLTLLLPATMQAQTPADSSKADSTKKASDKNISNVKGAKGGKKDTTIVVPAETKVTGADTSAINKIPAAPDSVKKHSPKKATIYSAILPGLGQVYNRKWWKVPIIYAGFAGVGYAIGFNQAYYIDFRQALKDRIDDDPNTIDPYVNKYSAANLDELQQFYRKNRDLSYIILGAVYVLNIIDANVDAHLFDFDVSNDLSLDIKPAAIPTFAGYGGGLALTLKFKK
ncbi:MAG: DUF5683 domain-containing protein [Sphingobacteriales bacterium JAD_PAG50586_3]|nr:MAG: DUF5683 domain-containing protein [Sphingobacteriales bacterium JAD_PAG50586_3]